MAAQSNVRAKLNALDVSLDDLENLLEPLFSQSLPETLLSLETIQQAKLQALLPYLLYDLVFIYLKTRGIDPRTHPVVSELERVKQYFEKLAKAEKEPQARPTTVDKAAAGRFIKHAIAQAKAVISSPQDSSAPSTSSEAATRVPVKVTAKMLARAEYEKEMRESANTPSDEDDGGLEVFDDNENEETRSKDEDEPMQMDSEDIASSSLKSKGKQKVKNSVTKPLAGNKRQRAVIDPFTGDRVPSSVPTTAPESELTPPKQIQPQPTKSKKRKTQSAPSDDIDAMSAATPDISKKAKKKKKAKKEKLAS